MPSLGLLLILNLRLIIFIPNKYMISVTWLIQIIFLQVVLLRLLRLIYWCRIIEILFYRVTSLRCRVSRLKISCFSFLLFVRKFNITNLHGFIYSVGLVGHRVARISLMMSSLIFFCFSFFIMFVSNSIIYLLSWMWWCVFFICFLLHSLWLR